MCKLYAKSMPLVKRMKMEKLGVNLGQNGMFILIVDAGCLN